VISGAASGALFDYRFRCSIGLRASLRRSLRDGYVRGAWRSCSDRCPACPRIPASGPTVRARPARMRPRTPWSRIGIVRSGDERRGLLGARLRLDRPVDHPAEIEDGDLHDHHQPDQLPHGDPSVPRKSPGNWWTLTAQCPFSSFSPRGFDRTPRPCVRNVSRRAFATAGGETRMCMGPPIRYRHSPHLSSVGASMRRCASFGRFLAETRHLWESLPRCGYLIVSMESASSIACSSLIRRPSSHAASAASSPNSERALPK
jgi:hypothetical protein